MNRTTSSQSPTSDAMNARLPACYGCGRTLREGESAWATDVKVIEATGVRLQTRYFCDSCESFRPERGKS